MMGTTHQQVGVAGAVALCAATSLPFSGAAVVCLAAARWSSTPDRMEKRFGAPHREWTHWLSSCVLTAVLPVAVVVLVLTLAGAVVDHGWHPVVFVDWIGHVPTVLRKVDAVAHGHRWHGSPGEFLVGLALILGTLVALGRVVAMCMHTLADACTPHGSPIWGPVDRELAFDEDGQPILDENGKQKTRVRKRHLTPSWFRIRTDSVDDTSVGYWALGLTVLVVWVALKGLVLPSPPGAHS